MGTIDLQAVHSALALILIALGMGYLVCAKAHDVDSKPGKFVGKVVGWLIMIVALVALACMAARCLMRCNSPIGGKACPRIEMPSMPMSDVEETK